MGGHCCMSIVSDQSVHYDLWPQHGFLGPSSADPEDGCDVIKKSKKQICSGHIRKSSSDTNNRVHSIQNRVNPISSPLQCSLWTAASHLHHIYMPKCRSTKYGTLTHSCLKLAKNNSQSLCRVFYVFFCSFFVMYKYTKTSCHTFTSVLPAKDNGLKRTYLGKPEYGWPDEVLQVVAFLAALSASLDWKINCNTVTVDTAYYCRAQQIGRRKNSINFSDTH